MEEPGSMNKEDQKWQFILRYVKVYRTYFYKIFLALILGSIIQLIFPFLTQSIVDVGINTANVQYITIVLIAQLMLTFGRLITEFIRGRLLLYASTRINISILSDFWIKLMKLPVSYFDKKRTGDILQRINDYHRIETFLTSTTLSTLFSLISLVIYSIVVLSYSYLIFLVFLSGSLLYYLWIFYFLRYRRKLDQKRFDLASKENDLTFQLIQGMQEIRLNNSENMRRWEWEDAQTRLFNVSFKSFSITQYQQMGGFFINEGKNILTTFLTAQAVINGQLSLGAMMAIQYIIGQLSNPIEQLVGFIQLGQDAKLSVERLNVIHAMKEEESAKESIVLIRHLPSQKGILIKNLLFSYPDFVDKPILNKIDLFIPEGKVTAIVGLSGSGKTTLLKILLRVYEDYEGEITIGQTSLKSISPQFWRTQCGSVMQDGYIFNDTIARNISMNENSPDYERLVYACKVANILSFIETTPHGFNTKIGVANQGISQGQKQRILIARAVYKNPQYLFFDEATNSLDVENEKTIIEKLEEVFEHKTVIIVAHRLSTVRNADKIVVLDNGKISEEGSHDQLVLKKRRYYELVKDQLELGN